MGGVRHPCHQMSSRPMSLEYNAVTSINATGMQRICHVCRENMLGLGKGCRGALLVCNEPR